MYAAKQLNEYRIAVVIVLVRSAKVPKNEDTFTQVLEDTLNRRQQAVVVKVLNFVASAYSVKQMAVTLQYRMLDLKPDLVVMLTISSDLNLSRTPSIIDESGYLIDQRLSHLGRVFLEV